MAQDYSYAVFSRTLFHNKLLMSLAIKSFVTSNGWKVGKSDAQKHTQKKNVAQKWRQDLNATNSEIAYKI